MFKLNVLGRNIQNIYLREPLQIILHPILNLGLCSLGAYEKNTNQFFQLIMGMYNPMYRDGKEYIQIQVEQ